ncbi:hypothetical protein J6590_092795, partial [Homalodisca vitripennis]
VRHIHKYACFRHRTCPTARNSFSSMKNGICLGLTEISPYSLTTAADCEQSLRIGTQKPSPKEFLFMSSVNLFHLSHLLLVIARLRTSRAEKSYSVAGSETIHFRW